ncbi:hypothetical protein Lser_V15G21528 [Lactuca serriola]
MSHISISLVPTVNIISDLEHLFPLPNVAASLHTKPYNDKPYESSTNRCRSVCGASELPTNIGLVSPDSRTTRFSDLVSPNNVVIVILGHIVAFYLTK